MDRIEFVRRPYRDGDRHSGIQIKINGRDLVEVVRAVENPFAYAEGTASIGVVGCWLSKLLGEAPHWCSPDALIRPMEGQ